MTERPGWIRAIGLTSLAMVAAFILLSFIAVRVGIVQTYIVHEKLIR
jgi:hypothetical protein